MVPANANHATGNESQKNTSTLRTFFERLKFWKRDKKEMEEEGEEEEEEPARLTPMPAWLMHWSTPLAIAILMFVSSMLITSIWGTATYDEIIDSLLHHPHRWPFHMHTPSHEAIKLCLTITGAGLAFSTWQQRSHDNVAKEKQEQATIERDDYWKRREHIYQLLGSKNPGLRLSAVALLAELADSASHNNLLNKTEKQQLQRHIINMLCLQLRHEGLNIPSEGTEDDHSEIQRETLNIILDRMDSNQKQNNRADWTKQPLLLRQCEIHTPISINNRRIECTLDLSDTTFHKEVSILNSDILTLIWESATFEEPLLVSSSSQNVIAADTMPQAFSFTQFTNIHIVSTTPRFMINFPDALTNTNVIRFEKCSFSQKVNSCTQTQSQTTQGGAIITDALDGRCIKKTTPTIILDECSISILQIQLQQLHSPIYIQKSKILKQLDITINFNPYFSNGMCNTSIDSSIKIDRNIFYSDCATPVKLQSDNTEELKSIIDFTDNRLTTTTSEFQHHALGMKLSQNISEPFHFFDQSTDNPNKRFIIPWDTGNENVGYASALACGVHHESKSLQIRLADYEDLKFIDDTCTHVREHTLTIHPFGQWPDGFPARIDIEDHITSEECYIISDDLGPLGFFIFSSTPYETYETITGKWRSDAHYHSIYRISANRGRGIAHVIFSFAASHADYIRCDTHQTNGAMRHALEEFGFQECGTLEADDGSIRVAYDWMKEPETHN